MASKKNNILEINGKRYDAVTGELISVHAHPSTHPSKKAAHHTARQPAKAAGRRPKPAKTLMRQAVKKPGKPGAGRHLKAQGSTDHLAKAPAAKVIVKKSAHRIHPRRLESAGRIPKSK